MWCEYDLSSTGNKETLHFVDAMKQEGKDSCFVQLSISRLIYSAVCILDGSVCVGVVMSILPFTLQLHSAAIQPAGPLTAPIQFSPHLLWPL